MSNWQKKVTELLSDVVVNVKDFGAKGDGIADDGDAIRTALNEVMINHEILFFPPGNYLITTGNLDIGHYEHFAIIGSGRKITTLSFTDTSISSLINFSTTYSETIQIKGLTLNGPGKAAGTNINGITGSTVGQEKDITFEDVDVENVSGSGWYFSQQDIYSSSWIRCTVRHAGKYGMYIRGGPGNYFENIGRYMDDIDDWVIWIAKGNKTVLSNINIGPCVNGMQFGGNQDDPDGTHYIHPVLMNVNIEPFSTNGINFKYNSSPAFMTNITLWAAESTTVNYGIQLDDPVYPGIVSNIEFNALSGGSYTKKVSIIHANDAPIIWLFKSMDTIAFNDLTGTTDYPQGIFPFSMINEGYKQGSLALMTNYHAIRSKFIVDSGNFQTPIEGAMRWDATNHKLLVYNGSAWETVTSS